jgi:hypothetical protein
MRSFQNGRIESVCAPIAVAASAAATTAVIDSQGCDYIIFSAYIGVTDGPASVLRIQETNNSDGTTSASTLTGSDLASTMTATDDGKLWRWYVPITGARKRYLKLGFTQGAGSSGTTFSAWAEKFSLKVSPTNNTERGVAASAFIA